MRGPPDGFQGRTALVPAREVCGTRAVFVAGAHSGTFGPDRPCRQGLFGPVRTAYPFGDPLWRSCGAGRQAPCPLPHTSVGLALAVWSESGYIAAFIRTANAVHDVPEGRPIREVLPIRVAVTPGLEFDAETARQRAIADAHPPDEEPHTEPRDTRAGRGRPAPSGLGTPGRRRGSAQRRLEHTEGRPRVHALHSALTAGRFCAGPGRGRPRRRLGSRSPRPGRDCRYPPG